MLPSFYKLVVEKYLPLLMHKFTGAMSHKRLTGSLLACCLRGSEFLEGVWKLSQELLDSRSRWHRIKITHFMKVGYVFT